MLWIVLEFGSLCFFSGAFSGAFFLKTVVLFLCPGLCWEFGVLCCSVVLFLVLLFENSCAFFVLWIVLEFGSLCCFLVLFFVLWIVLF